SPTWKQIQAYEEANNVNGFDLIICRPQGPFGYYTHQDLEGTQDIERTTHNTSGEVFATLLDRTLDLMSPDDGAFFLQLPVLNIESSTVRKFWREYISRKEREGYEFNFGKTAPEVSRRVLIRRHR